MLKKKNYKQEQHFSQLQTLSINGPNQHGLGSKKYQIYYKRYRRQQETQNVYQLINNKQKSQGQQIEQLPTKYSQDRTLQLISFDGNIGFLKKYLRKIGKIRSYQTGEGIYKGKKIHTAMCVFKFQFDLVKCFREGFLQNKIDEQSFIYSNIFNQQDREEQRFKLINQHLSSQYKEKIDKIKQLQKGGFQVVTDLYGQYRMDYEANKKLVENLPQIKKKNKKLKQQQKIKQQRQKLRISQLNQHKVQPN